MRKSIWLSFGLAVSLNLAYYPLILVMPEAWKPGHLSQLSKPTREQSMSPNRNVQQPSPMAEHEQSQEPASLRYSAKVRLGKLQGFLFKNFEFVSCSKLAILFYSILRRAIAISNTTFIFQYASKRLRWEPSQIALLVGLKSAGVFLTTGITIPVSPPAF